MHRCEVAFPYPQKILERQKNMIDKPTTEEVVATVIHHHTFTVSKRYSFPANKILGIGCYGVVTAAYDKIRKTNVAIKRVRPYAKDELLAKSSLREMRCLKLLSSHPNVLFYYFSRTNFFIKLIHFIFRSYPYLVCPLMRTNRNYIL